MNIEKNLVIDCPIEDILPCLIDTQHLKIWMPGFINQRQQTEGEVRTGTRLNQNWKMDGQAHNINVEIADLALPNRLQITSHSPSYDFYFQWRCETVLKGTSINFYSKIIFNSWKFKWFKGAYQKKVDEKIDLIFARFIKYLENGVRKGNHG